MNYSFYVNMSMKELGATRKVQTLESFARTGTNSEKSQRRKIAPTNKTFRLLCIDTNLRDTNKRVQP